MMTQPSSPRRATAETAEAILVDCAQLIDGIRPDAILEGWWSDWDQSVRDRITAFHLRVLSSTHDEATDEAYAWAVVESGAIKVRTIMDTRRAAIVNWLVTERHRMFDNETPDDLIERWWFEHKGAAEVEQVCVGLALPSTHDEAIRAERERIVFGFVNAVLDAAQESPGVRLNITQGWFIMAGQEFIAGRPLHPPRASSPRSVPAEGVDQRADDQAAIRSVRSDMGLPAEAPAPVRATGEWVPSDLPATLRSMDFPADTYVEISIDRRDGTKQMLPTSWTRLLALLPPGTVAPVEKPDV